MAKQLEGVRVAVLAADGFEQVELTKPWKKLKKAGADLELVSLRRGKIQGMNFLFRGDDWPADRTVFKAKAADYDALFIPGGFVNPDLMRQSEAALDFVRGFAAAGKPIATLCHGPLVLISAGLVRGRQLAAWPGIKDDLRNAGAEWHDAAVVRDENWLSSRSPLDLPEYLPALVRHFAELVPVRRPSVMSRLRPVIGTGLATGALVAAASHYARQYMKRDTERVAADRYRSPSPLQNEPIPINRAHAGTH